MKIALCNSVPFAMHSFPLALWIMACIALCTGLLCLLLILRPYGAKNAILNLESCFAEQAQEFEI